MPRRLSGLINPTSENATSEQADLKVVQHALAGHPMANLVVDGQEFALPYAALDALRSAISHLVRGVAIQVVPMDRELSTGEAAAILGVSRQYFTRLVDTGEIQSTRPHTHRRVTMAAVMDYAERRRAKRYRAVHELSEQSQSLGAYEPD